MSGTDLNEVLSILGVFFDSLYIRCFNFLSISVRFLKIRLHHVGIKIEPSLDRTEVK